jgi:hypothetical protein
VHHSVREVGILVLLELLTDQVRLRDKITRINDLGIVQAHDQTASLAINLVESVQIEIVETTKNDDQTQLLH